MTTESLIAAFHDERDRDTESMTGEALAGQLLLLHGTPEAALAAIEPLPEASVLRRARPALLLLTAP